MFIHTYIHTYELYTCCTIFIGKYCVESTVNIPVTAGTDCPIGTYGASAGLEAEANCTACDGGHYCETTGDIYLS